MKRKRDYTHHLDRVSRSFAFCIARLPEPLRSEVALTYLLCRLLDTIEDASWSQPELQEEHFNLFDKRLTDQQDQTPLTFSGLLKPLPAGEQELLGFQNVLFSDFHELPSQSRDILYRTIQSMSRGMRHFALTRPDRVFQVTSLMELKIYCFFVAGVIGEALTLLFSKYEPKFLASKDNLERSVHFGLFLQIVNILKDHHTDEAEGRFFIPDKKAVLASLKAHGQGALQYLLQIPRQQTGYRIFCAWSLFLGLFTLPQIAHPQHFGKPLRVSRLQTWSFLQRVESKIGDDEALRALFEELMAKANLPTCPPSSQSLVLNVAALDSPHQFAWIQGCYLGRLSLNESPVFSL